MSACGHDHDADAGLHGAALGAALQGAADRCDAAGERLTPPRRRVLELLLEAGTPVKAYDLMAAYGDESAKPPTVYRALEFLARQGLAHRIESLNAFIACRLGESAHAAGFLICDCCGAAREIAPPNADWAVEAAARAGYVLSSVKLEAHGRCSDCASA